MCFYVQRLCIVIFVSFYLKNFLVFTDTLDKLSADFRELPPSTLARDQGLDISWKGTTNLSEPSWNSVNRHPKSLSNLYMEPMVNFNRSSTNVNVIQHESSLFSSSLSEMFSRKSKCFLSTRIKLMYIVHGYVIMH